MKYFIGNWKMFGVPKSINILNKINSFYSRDTNKKKYKIIITPPYTLIETFSKYFKRKKIFIGSQNCYQKNINITLPMPDNSEKTIAETLLEPTKIYVKLILDLLNSSDQIKAISNITGGGITENLPRIFENENIGAKINLSSWVRPSIFNWLQELGNIDEKEMLKTLNCGIGMILVINQKDITKISKILEKKNEDFYIIGEIIETHIDSPKVVYHRD